MTHILHVVKSLLQHLTSHHWKHWSLDDGRAVGVGLQCLPLALAELDAVLAGAVTLEGLGEPERQFADEAHQDRLRGRVRMRGGFCCWRGGLGPLADGEHSVRVHDGLVTLLRDDKFILLFKKVPLILDTILPN